MGRVWLKTKYDNGMQMGIPHKGVQRSFLIILSMISMTVLREKILSWIISISVTRYLLNLKSSHIFRTIRII